MNKARRFTPLGLVLIISLVANALLVGLLLGNRLGTARPGDHLPGAPGGGGSFFIARGMESVVPEETRGELHDAFREAFRESRDARLRKHDARLALSRALAAEPFDEQAVEEAFTAIREADDALTARFQETLTSELAALEPEQRAALVAWMKDMQARREKHMRRRGDHHRRPPEDGGPPPGETP